MPKRLLVSIHDVSPVFETEIDALVDLVSAPLECQRFAMLVVPNHWGDAPISEAKAFQGRLRRWADAGIEMFVHGWFHKDMAQHSGFASLRARHMTAGEGEFLGLTADVAAQRMADGQMVIEDIIGRPVTGFVAPAWLYGEGAYAALQQSGFALAEDHFRVWQPASGNVVARGPVITWASRSRARRLSSYVVAAGARVGHHALQNCRVAVHPGDVAFDGLKSSITKTLRTLSRDRNVEHYKALI